MRIAIIGFLHESNTFASGKTTLQDFRASDFHVGPALMDHWREAHHELGGFIEGVEQAGLEPVPVFAAWATPGGPVAREAYEEVLRTIESGLREAGAVDGVLLALHGSMVAEGLDSADGETAQRVRRMVGEDTPVVLSLDMHANVSAPMAQAVDGIVAYKTYPHVDQRQCGLDAARLLTDTLVGEVRPYLAVVKLPMLIHIARQYTGQGAMKSLMDRVREAEQKPSIQSVSLAPGYIYADVPHMGAAVLCVANGPDGGADAEAMAIALETLSSREELNAALPTVEQAMSELPQQSPPVCLMDCGDNIGGGGTGDSTVMFHALAQGGTHPFCGILHDPAAVEKCQRAGTGARVELQAGGKNSASFAPPFSVSGEIICLDEGQFVEPEPRHGGQRYFNQGPTAVVRTGEGDLIVLNSLRIMPTSLRQLTSLGIEPDKMRAIIIKGAIAPLAGYGPIAGDVVVLDSPGVTQAGPEAFAYEKRPAPLYPLDAAGEEELEQNIRRF